MFDDPSMIRFIVMPIVGLLLGIRDGHLDAKAATAPFDYTMKEMVKATYIPFFMMTFINILAQANSGQGINMLEAVGMGGLCAGLLYTLARNISNQAFFHDRYSTETAGAESNTRK
jgi:hypothetical protein